MIDSIYFNNKNSYKDLDLLLVEASSNPVGTENVELIEVEGRNGTLTRKLGTYKDKIRKIKFRLNTSDEKYYRRIDEIISWLNIIEDNSLVFSYDRERKYKVKVIQCGDITRQLQWYGDFEVIFTCEPFKFPIEDDVISTTQKIFTIYNDGNIKSEPYMKIIGSGNITVFVNGQTIILNNVSEYIELDSMFFLCKKGLTNEMSKMNGKFPIFEIGENSIEITGNVFSTEINIRTRYL